MFSRYSALLFWLNLFGSALSAPSRTDSQPAACTPSSGSNDDAKAIGDAISKCGNGGVIVIPQGYMYNVGSPIKFEDCKGCEFQLDGTLKVTSDPSSWSSESYIISFKGANGLLFHSPKSSGVIDGNGQEAWDEFAKNKSLKRPRMIQIEGSATNVTVAHLTLKDPPTFFVSQSGNAKDMHYEDLVLTAQSNSENLPKNTDGIDIGDSSYTTIKNVHITNYDDCIAFKPGCNYLTVTNVTCAGKSHGLSIGSLGESSNDNVTNVYLDGAHMINATKAAGIKLYSGGKGHGVPYVKNVTWSNVHVDGCAYGAQIQSCYGTDDDEDCDKNPSKATLSDVHFNNFHGQVSGKYKEDTANLNCPGAGTCDVQFSNWNVTVPNKNAEVLCDNTPKDLGVECQSGASG